MGITKACCILHDIFALYLHYILLYFACYIMHLYKWPEMTYLFPLSRSMKHGSSHGMAFTPSVLHLHNSNLVTTVSITDMQCLVQHYLTALGFNTQCSIVAYCLFMIGVWKFHHKTWLCSLYKDHFDISYVRFGEGYVGPNEGFGDV